MGDYVQRYFAKDKINNAFILSDDDMRHIKLVMRMKDNDEVIVVDNKKPYLCYLKGDQIIIKEELENSINDLPYACLIIPILKEQKMDYILQKATELGVSEIIAYYAERSVIKETDNNVKKIDRWKRIIKEASEQSHRLDIPKISILKLKDLNLDGINIICTTHEKQEKLKNILKSINIYDRINVVIGPEGGFSDEEEILLINKRFKPITLGNRILRVETVPLFIMSMVNYEIME